MLVMGRVCNQGSAIEAGRAADQQVTGGKKQQRQ
jgi:hypothetical protein